MELKKQSYTPLLPLNLQLFSDDNPNGGNEDNQNNNENPPATITLTQEELNLKLQQESDRRVTEALKKFEAKKTQEFESRLQLEREEAEKLAKLSEEERRKVEEEKEQMKRDEERKAFEKEKQEFQRERLFVQTEKELVSENLPPAFASFLMADDAEKTNENIKAFKTTFDEAVKIQANAALGGKPPAAGSGKQLSELEQLQKDYSQAVQSKNMPLAISLKNKIHSLQQ